MYLKIPEDVKHQLTFENFEKLARKRLQEVVGPELEQRKASLDKYAQTFPDHLNKMIGVLCLCEERDSLLMWAHYARSHTGFVVEYRTDNPFFQAKRGDDDEFFHLRQVIYKPDRPSKMLADLGSDDVFVTKE